MRKEQQIQGEFKKLRRIIHHKAFTPEQKDKAWGMLMGIQWMRGKKEHEGITLLELLNADVKQTSLIKKGRA